MKKYIIIIIVLFSMKTFGQQTSDITPIIIKASNSVNTTFIPPNPIIFGKVTQEATIIVNYIDGTPTNEKWSNEAKNAFEYAVGLWEKSIYSDVEIHIDAYFKPLGSGTLGSARASNAFPNFSVTGINTDLFENNYYYVQALANKLHQSDLSGTVDIIANFSSTFPFYFGTDGACPTTKYDFVTVVLHEIAHGLGFTSNIGDDLESKFGSNDYPFIYSKFLKEGTTNLVSLSSPSTSLANMLTSDNLYWNNYKVYAPSTFDEGSSISHLDQSTYGNTNNRLMSPFASKGPGVHSLGAVGIDIMEQIGWGEVLDMITGSTPFWIYPHWDSFYIQNQTDGGSLDDNVPFMVLEQNKVYNLHAGTDYVRLVAFHTNGSYFINGSYNNNSLPDTYDWKRDKDGYVQGYVEHYICNDCASSGERQMVKFEKTPNKPSFGKKQYGVLSDFQVKPTNCDEIEFTFYSEDAVSYTILYKSEDDFVETGIIIPQDVHTYNITGLDENLDYEFKVEAMNSFGFSMSNTYFRSSCALEIRAFPNPTVDVIRVKDNDDNTRITDVEIRKIDNPSIVKISSGSSTNEVDINVNDLPNGTYNIKVTDETGKQSSKIFIKF